MSQSYDTNATDKHSLIPFTDALLDSVIVAAKNSPRRRTILRFHEHDEPVQRMLNAIEPDSYARPHLHPHPTKHEAFVALRGNLLVARFDEAGTPIEGYVISAGGPIQGIEVPPGAWHTIVALESGTVIFEINSGPYDSDTHKEFAAWSPPEEDKEGGAAYMQGLRAHFASMLPEIAVRDMIAAEEDEIL